MAQTLGEYINEIRKRHRIGNRVLSKSQMATEAGLGVSTISAIIAGATSASPATIEKIADTWGTDHDFREMMRLAGWPLPEGPQLTDDERKLLEYYRWLNNEGQEALLDVLAQANGDITGTELVTQLEHIAIAAGGLDRDAIIKINRALLRFLGALIAMPDTERYAYLVDRIAELYANRDEN